MIFIGTILYHLEYSLKFVALLTSWLTVKKKIRLSFRCFFVIVKFELTQKLQITIAACLIIVHSQLTQV